MFQAPFRSLAEWLAGSPFSEALQNWFWIIPTLQIFHILALAAVMASVWMLYLRVMGVAGRAYSIADMSRRFVPWIWGALAILTVSGGLLVVSEPLDSLLKSMFQLKMALLVVAIVLTLVFQNGVRRSAYEGSNGESVSSGTKLLGALSLAVWLAITIAGRLIAYV